MAQNSLLPDQNTTNPLKFAYNLEALRGIVALVVVVHHIFFYNSYLDPTYNPSDFKFFTPLGHLGVLVFFVLSGYVIGLSSKRLAEWREIVIYLKKRFVRLYPIYIISIIIALLVSTSSYSWSTIFHNLTFTEIIFSPLIWENNPIWSLHYEVLYYLLFIPISYFRINPFIVVILSIIIAILNFFVSSTIQTPIVTSYAFGLSFWASGLAMGNYFKFKEETFDYTKLISWVFLLFSLGYYNILTTLLNKAALALFNHPLKFFGLYWPTTMNHYQDLSYLPYFLLLILTFVEATFKYKKQITLVLFLLPSLTLIYIFRNFHNAGPFLLPGICYALSLILQFFKSNFLNKLSEKIIKKAIWFGGLSYGIYIVHFPILVLFKGIDLFSGSPVTFIVRFILYLFITIGLSYLLEKKFQPLAKKYLMG